MASQTDQTKVYQFRLWLKGVSPMIWRRFLIRDDGTIADLHYIIQIAMEWEDYYLHKFTIHGKTLGVSRVGGEIFSKDADEIFLKDFQFYIVSGRKLSKCIQYSVK